MGGWPGFYHGAHVAEASLEASGKHCDAAFNCYTMQCGKTTHSFMHHMDIQESPNPLADHASVDIPVTMPFGPTPWVDLHSLMCNACSLKLAAKSAPAKLLSDSDRRLSVRALTNNLFTNCTTLRYESMWTRQGRVYLLRSRKSVLGEYRYQYSCYFCFVITLCIYIFSLSMFVFLWVCVIRPAQLVFFNVLSINPPSEVSRFPT